MSFDFNSLNKPTDKSFAKFDAPGQTLQGTLVGVSMVTDRENPAKQNMTFDILTPEGETKMWGPAVAKNKMASVKVGQYVRIVFKGKLKPQGRPAYNDFDVFADSKAVNEEWLKENVVSTDCRTLASSVTPNEVSYDDLKDHGFAS